MPIFDPTQSRRKRRVPGSDFLAWLNAVTGKRGGPKKGLSGGFVPVEPDGPGGLTGGAVVDLTASRTERGEAARPPAVFHPLQTFECIFSSRAKNLSD